MSLKSEKARVRMLALVSFGMAITGALMLLISHLTKVQAAPLTNPDKFLIGMSNLTGTLSTGWGTVFLAFSLLYLALLNREESMGANGKQA
jgi:hypothetical protein